MVRTAALERASPSKAGSCYCTQNAFWHSAMPGRCARSPFSFCEGKSEVCDVILQCWQQIVIIFKPLCRSKKKKICWEDSPGV